MEKRVPTAISRQSLQRMPYYVKCLTQMQSQGVESVSAPMLATLLKLNEVQVRKDLAAVSRAKGKPKSGFPLNDLLEDLKDFLGYNDVDTAVLVGAGSIGRALMGYKGFEEYGLRIVAAFDTKPELAGQHVGGKTIYPLSSLPDICQRLGVHIGIIAVPAPSAQSVCDLLVQSGIQGVWNFAPTHLDAPEDILIQNENMAASLAMLSNHLRARMRGEEFS